MIARRAESTQDPLYTTIMYYIEDLLEETSALSDIAAFLPALTWLETLTGIRKRYKHLTEQGRDPAYGRIIQEGLETGKDCVYRRMVESREEYELDDVDLLVTTSDIIGAASDTTSTTLAWSLAILCHHPEVQKKISSELDQFIETHGRLPTFAERDNFPYMISVQKECLRYRTINHMGIPHAAEADFEYNGYVIPKGAMLISNVAAMHMNPDDFANPEVFIPERFIHNTTPMAASANGKIEDRDVYSFGWGRRLCPGIHLAEAEIFTVYTHVFANCTIEPSLDAQGQQVYPDIDDAVQKGIVTAPVDYYVRFCERVDRKKH
ncbi:hypothetical protein DFQ29_000293 [Apophysomyces sp. BC1021]|nr:hypothetical protein DFQ29_000293 [Apophysomyces sp. BC1021]